MTKTYPIIALNNFLYAIDKEGKTKWVLHKIHGIRDISIEKTHTLEDHLAKNWLPIVASNDPSLGLPLLPDIEENVKQISEALGIENAAVTYLKNKCNFPENLLKIAADFANFMWEEGYKANKAKYTEDDMINFTQSLTSTPSNISREAAAHMVKYFTKSLSTTIPVSVDLEIEQEELGNVFNGKNSNTMYSDPKPKVTNNYVTVNKWNYE